MPFLEKGRGRQHHFPYHHLDLLRILRGPTRNSNRLGHLNFCFDTASVWLFLGVLCVMRKTLVLFFLHISSALLHTTLCTYFLLELTHAFLFHADNMLGKGMLAELKALARNHGLATGSQIVPNSVVEKAIVHRRSPPKEPAAQRKKLVLKRPKRKAPQVIHEEEEEDDEVTEDGLVTKRKRVAPSSPPAPPPLPTSTPPSTPAPPPSSPPPQAPASPVQALPLRHCATCS